MIWPSRDYAAGRAPLPAAPDAPVSITLPRGLTVKGRVTAADGTPLGDVGVSVAESGPMLTFHSFGHVADMSGAGSWARTDADGRYALHLHPVVHQISFYKPGHAPRVIDSFDPRSGRDLDVVLGPAAAIAGHVVRPTLVSPALRYAQDRSNERGRATDATELRSDRAPGPHREWCRKTGGRQGDAHGRGARPLTSAWSSDGCHPARPRFDAVRPTPRDSSGSAPPNPRERVPRRLHARSGPGVQRTAGGALVLEVPVGGSTLTVRAEAVALKVEAWPPPPMASTALGGALGRWRVGAAG